ncbi:hypothetical protein L198_08245 [Cryptococcus wingfieldii CBS 7118]|uniref:Uncharacterized protein n=1 Tax=Cryptococcus wingfieldii CBS 7118 TaxID=1295528 RepID=A0A1E3HD59_9TREE|nr:hypothetical protein L198_08245 [Cryptococcus wingfieldii CBS 7118]ODN74280.1 hypothetical protein L198_08245 [Cryptococcus wingfieldii CBS 7118]
MPYVTEDLWANVSPVAQGDACESIMISAFPEKIAEQSFPKEAAAFDLVVPSLVCDNLPTNGKTVETKINVIIQAENDDKLQFFKYVKTVVVGLTKGYGKVEFIRKDSEISPVGAGTEGKIDAASEIDKLEKKAVVVEGQKAKINKGMGMSNYETSVKEVARAQNSDKLEKINVEIESLTLAIERFKLLLL